MTLKTREAAPEEIQVVSTPTSGEEKLEALKAVTQVAVARLAAQGSQEEPAAQPDGS